MPVPPIPPLSRDTARKLLRSSALLIALAVVVAVAPGAGAQPAATTRTVALAAHGGASLTAPDYREVRKDDAVAVLEQLPDAANQKAFRVLVCAIEEGPTGNPEAIPWDKVKDNVVKAAKKSGRDLTLSVGEAFSGAEGFVGRRLVGELAAANGRKVGVEVVALVKDAKLVTVGLLADAIGDPERAVLDAVARSARLGK